MTFTEILSIFTTYWHIISFFFIIAILYSSVGFGGGSSYLAVLALTGLAFTQLRATSLLCNIVVVTGNVILFQREQLYEWKKVIPLVLFSIPLAFLGGYIKISQSFFFILLGITLCVAAVTMWLSKKITSKAPETELNLIKNASYGGFIGFISGMVGIGGGIFLAPLLHLTNWSSPKRIAATASFFIFVNSISGLLGQLTNPNFEIDWQLTSILLGTVFVGGQIGSKISNNYFTPIQLKKTTAILIAIVGLRILWRYL